MAKLMIDHDPSTRLKHVIDSAWELIFEKISLKKLSINKESSLQLHFSKLIFDLGNLYCIFPNEYFDIEMETNHETKNIDIVCGFGDIKAAVELKCFMKASNRAKDLDCYDALIDIERLHNFSGFAVKKFICLTNNSYYSQVAQKGYGSTVSLKHGTTYPAQREIIPGWANKWNVKRDKSITFKSDVTCDWVSKSNWHYWNVNVD